MNNEGNTSLCVETTPLLEKKNRPAPEPFNFWKDNKKPAAFFVSFLALVIVTLYVYFTVHRNKSWVIETADMFSIPELNVTNKQNCFESVEVFQINQLNSTFEPISDNERSVTVIRHVEWDTTVSQKHHHLLSELGKQTIADLQEAYTKGFLPIPDEIITTTHSQFTAPAKAIAKITDALLVTIKGLHGDNTHKKKANKRAVEQIFSDFSSSQNILIIWRHTAIQPLLELLGCKEPSCSTKWPDDEYFRGYSLKFKIPKS